MDRLSDIPKDTVKPRLDPRYDHLENVHCPRIEGTERVAEGYLEYTIDESRTEGKIPERIYFPTNTEEVSSALAEITSRDEQVTVSGARTGIVGGAVCNTPNVISLEKLLLQKNASFDSERGRITTGAGTILSDLGKLIPDSSRLFYPVDPTETSASVGGTVATNASGAKTLAYGPTRAWIEGLTLRISTSDP